MSNNLAIEQLAENQAAPEVTVNDGTAAFDAALTEILTIDLTGGNAVLTDLQFRRNAKFVITGVATSGRTVTFNSAIKRAWSYFQTDIANTDPVTLILGATSVSLTPGRTFIVSTDGTANGLQVNDASAANDIHLFVPGVMDNAQLIYRLRLTRPLTLPINLAGSYASCVTAPTADTVLLIKRNGLQIPAGFPTLDGSAHAETNNHTDAHISGTLTTTLTEDVIVLQINAKSDDATSPTVTGIGGSLTWHNRFRHATTQGSDHVVLEEWWAYAPLVQAGVNYTVTLDRNCGRIASHVFGVHNANIDAPFDTNGALPAFTDNTSGTNTTTHNVTFSSSNYDVMLIEGLADDTGNLGAGAAADSGWTKILDTANFSVSLATAYKTVADPQTSITHNVWGSYNDSHYTAFIDAIIPKPTGSITFAMSANTGTFDFASEVMFLVGDFFSVHGPATADVTLADVSLDLFGTR